MANFLPAVTILALEEEARTLWGAGQFHAAGVGRGAHLQRRAEMRSDHVLWLEEHSAHAAQQAYFTRMEALRSDLEQQLFLGLITLEAHLAVYPVGAHYHRHTDALAGVSTRVLSTVLYLHQRWVPADGGTLRLYVPGTDGETIHDVVPLSGSMALFLSDEVEHEVLPATRERLSLTGWLLRR